MIVAGLDLWHYRSIVSGVTELIEFTKWLIKERGYDVFPIREKITEEDLEDAMIFLILSPGYLIEEDEVNVIHEWVKRGGTLVVSRPVGKVDIVNPLLEKFGARFNGLKSESYAFFADIPQEAYEKSESYRKIKRILSNHEINRGLKAVAEGLPKENKKPYLIDILETGWHIIGASTYKGEAFPVAAIRELQNGTVVVLGILYLFYKWRFWLKNRDLEEKEESYLSNYTFIEKLFKYIEKKYEK